MNLYEFNQYGYSALPDMTEEQLMQAKIDIFNWLLSHHSKYYMLLNVEGRYYTVFTQVGMGDMAQTILETAKELGEIKSVELSLDENSIEFWIYDSFSQTCNMYALFDYAKGVIEV